jgi:hypothetical protein
MEMVGGVLVEVLLMSLVVMDEGGEPPLLEQDEMLPLRQRGEVVVEGEGLIRTGEVNMRRGFLTGGTRRGTG